MTFLLGVMTVVIVLFLIARQATTRLNKSTLQPFSAWRTDYESSDGPTRHGLSRALLIQTFHLAEKMNVISRPERNEFRREMRKEDPAKVVDDWMDAALPHIVELGGQNILADISARDVGLYMFICVKGVNPQGDLRRFLQRFDTGHLKSETESHSILDQAQELSGKLVVSAYRGIASQSECAPTEKTSDQQIIDIYEKVLTAFRRASEQRNENLTAGTLNYIAWKFLQVKEMLGSDMVDSHLEYEIEKYIQEGLRADYQQELKLF